MDPDGRYFADDVSCRLEGRTLRVANLGPGGLFVATSADAVAGQTVVFDLRLAGGTPFRIVGEVSWVNHGRRHADALPEGFGVRFVGMGERERNAIEDFLRGSDRMVRRRQRRRGPAGA